MADWYRNHQLSPESSSDEEYRDWAHESGAHIDLAGNVVWNAWTRDRREFDLLSDLAERTEERDTARREADEQARLRANAETALASAVERARIADQRARIAEQALRRHDERDAQLRRAEVERTGGR